MSCHAIQLDLTACFDGPDRKQRGMAKAESARTQLVAECREYAARYAREHGTVTADDVQAWLISQGKSSADLGNAAGSVFARGFVRVGYTQSCRDSNNSRVISIWRLAC